MKKHQHRANPRHRQTVGFSACAAPCHCDPMAHGNVCEIDYCRCGASRRTNINAGRGERGPWELPASR